MAYQIIQHIASIQLIFLTNLLLTKSINSAHFFKYYYPQAYKAQAYKFY